MSEGLFVLNAARKPVPLRDKAFDSEDEFQRLIAESPELLAGDQIDPEAHRRWLLVAREKGIPSEYGAGGWWAVDHLLLDQEGIPTFVEVKRRSDARLRRREVVAQMLDYAANALAYWPVDEIRRAFQTRVERPDKELRARLGQDLDVTSFWERVKTNLQAGRIRLLFVADRIPSELRRVVEFLNAQMAPAEVLAIEVRRYVGQDMTAFVPIVYGRTEAAQQRKDPEAYEKSWTEIEFLDDLRQRHGEKSVEIAKSIATWAQAHKAVLSYGRGSKDVSMAVSFVGQGHKVTPLRVWTYGRIEIAFQGLSGSRLDSVENRRDLLQRINQIPGVALPDDAIHKYPSIWFDVLQDATRLGQFLEIMTWVAKEISVL